MNRVKGFVAVVAIACGVVFGTGALAAETYTVTRLATPGGWRGHATGINDAGDVVGWIYPFGEESAFEPTHAVVWKDGVMGELGTPVKGNADYALGINDTGMVVGLTERTPSRAVLWEGGRPLCLEPQKGSLALPRAVNNAGQVAGASYTEVNEHTSYFRATLWSHGTIEELRPLGGAYSEAIGINDAGQVAGVSTVAEGSANQHAVLWDHGIIRDLGTLGGPDSRANGINNAGDVVGSASAAEYTSHAFLWRHSTMIDLGTFGEMSSTAKAINNRGEVIGKAYSYLPDFPYYSDRVVIWTDGIPRDLNHLVSGTGWVIEAAEGINDKGQIVGLGVRDGEHQAIVLTPVSAP